MKKMIAVTTLFLILMGALPHNTDWRSSACAPEDRQLHIDEFSDPDSKTSLF